MLPHVRCRCTGPLLGLVLGCLRTNSSSAQAIHEATTSSLHIGDVHRLFLYSREEDGLSLSLSTVGHTVVFLQMASMILMDCSSSSTTETRFLPLSRHRIRDGLLHSRRWMPLRFAPTSPSLLGTTAATSCTPSPSVLTGLLFSLFRIMINFSREHLS